MKSGKVSVLAALVVSGLLVVGVPVAVFAQLTTNSNLSQSITAGVLSTSIRDASGAIVSSPVFGMDSVEVSTSVQTATGTFGNSTQRIAVDNPGGANDGWTLSLNATTPGTGTWTSGGNTYAYNGNGTTTGQLTVNPAAGTITDLIGGSASVTLGASAAFTGSTPITLVTAAAASADIWNGYVTGIELSQVIPAATPAGTYTLNVTQTVAAT